MKCNINRTVGRTAYFNSFRYNENKELVFSLNHEKVDYWTNLRFFPITEMELNNEFSNGMSAMVFDKHESYTIYVANGEILVFGKTPSEWAAGCNYIINNFDPEDTNPTFPLAFQRRLSDDR